MRTVLATYHGTVSPTFTMRHKMGIFATRSKSISQSLQRVVRNRTFEHEITTHRNRTMCSELS